jgi:hypothetical protein
MATSFSEHWHRERERDGDDMAAFISRIASDSDISHRV